MDGGPGERPGPGGAAPGAVGRPFPHEGGLLLGKLPGGSLLKGAPLWDGDATRPLTFGDRASLYYTCQQNYDATGPSYALKIKAFLLGRLLAHILTWSNVAVCAILPLTRTSGWGP